MSTTQIKRLRATPWAAAAWEMEEGETAFRIRFAGAGRSNDAGWRVARLIEAAPQMLATLQTIDRILSEVKGASSLRRPVRAAIRKALKP